VMYGIKAFLLLDLSVAKTVWMRDINLFYTA
jgi:hypothetical protein